MSASEKLKALDAGDEWSDYWHYYMTDKEAALFETLRCALPQIVAVVEAAERVLVPWEKTKGPAAVEQILGPVRGALADLEEALKGDA